MDPRHAADFEALILDLADLYDRQAPSQQTVHLWWTALEAYPWPLVRAAAGAHVRACKFFPRPADLIERLVSSDGRPDPDEAWATAIQAEDEATTLVWTEETAAAWGIARPVLEAGDKVAARKTFIAAYERLTAEARHDLKPATWSVSLGHDPDAREAPIRRAIAQGQIPPTLAKTLLPPGNETQQRLNGQNAPTGLLTGAVTNLPGMEARNRARFLAIIRQAQTQNENAA